MRENAAHPSEERPSRSSGRLERWLLLLLVWMAFAVVLATQAWFGYREAGRDVSWLSLFGRQAQLWGAWALLTPLVWAVAARVVIVPGRVLRGVAVHVPLAIAFILIHLLLVGPLVWMLGIYQPGGADATLTASAVFLLMLRSNFGAGLLVYTMLVAIHHMVEYGAAMREREIRQSQLEAQLARARLDVLQMQLQPHFLFNTLHAVSALMERDVPAARRMLAQLSDLLRMSLAARDAQEVAVEEEMDFLGRYIDIQRTRFHDRLVVDVDVDPQARRALVPKLLMQPLVENAIRHGIATRTGPGRIEVAVRLRNGDVHLTVTDNGRGLPSGGMAAVREGVGLRNTRGRLEQLYGRAQTFELLNAPSGGAIAHIRIPFRPAGSPEG